MIYYSQLLKDGSIYDKNGIYIKYYTEKQFEKYKPFATIIGSIKLIPEVLSEENNILIVQTQINSFQFKINPLNIKDKVFGYIYIGDNNFIKIVKKKNKKIPIIIFSIIAILAIGIGSFIFLNKYKKNDIKTPLEPEQILSLSNEKTEIPLYESFDLTIDESNIKLSNPKYNSVDFKYEIYNNNSLLFSTDFVKPGEEIPINMSDYLELGEHNLVFKIRCFFNNNEVNGTEELVKVIIK